MTKKNVSRRQFLYMASSTAAAALLASCAPAATPAVQSGDAPKEVAAPKEPVKLRWWGGVPEPNGPQQTVEAWNAANSDIQVEYVQYPNNDEGNVKLDTALMVGGEVDVVVSYGLTRLKQRADAGALEPLDAYLDGFDPEKEFGKLDNRWDGKYWALILNMQPYMVFINKQAFDEAGLTVPTDWTWDEMMDAARKTSKGEGATRRYGVFLNGEWGLDPAIYDRGGDFMYKDQCTTNYDDPLFNWALNLRKSMQDTDKSAMPYGDVLAAKLTPFGEFLAGHTAMLVEGSWILRYIKNTTEYPRDFMTTMAPIPHPSGGPNGFRPGTADDRASIAANSKLKAESYKFLKWWGTEGYIHMTPFGRTTLWKGRTAQESSQSFTSDFAEKEKYMDVEAYERVMYGNMEKNFPIPTRSEAAAEIGTIQREEVGKVLLGEATVEKGLSELKRRADDALGKVC
jgi:multiple sugar transport system substrate-binding protein